MVRLIRRYGGGSRKLYDTEESRYVSLDEIAAWIKGGQELRVEDSASGADVTAQTLSQIIYEDAKRGMVQLPSRFLHDVIRKGGRAIAARVERVQTGVDRMVKAGVEKMTPVGGMQEEMALLRDRLAELEETLAGLESAPAGNGTKRKPGRRRAR